MMHIHSLLTQNYANRLPCAWASQESTDGRRGSRFSASEAHDTRADVASQFTWAIFGGVKYCSQAYTRVSKRNML